MVEQKYRLDFECALTRMSLGVATNGQSMKIGDLARRTGLTAYTIRYYERIKLLPRAARGRSRQREYDASILPWIEFLGRLKTTGMPIRDMVRFAELRAKGPATEAERRDILTQHRQNVRAHVAALHACLSVLDAKIAGYAGRDRMEKTNESERKPHRRPVRQRLARTL
jgi:DNA-binding transcriptional MerR regulator